MDLNTLIMGVVLAVMGGLFGIMYLASIPKSSKHLRQKNTDLEELNTYNKKEMKSLRAKVNSDHALRMISVVLLQLYYQRLRINFLNSKD